MCFLLLFGNNLFQVQTVPIHQVFAVCLLRSRHSSRYQQYRQEQHKGPCPHTAPIVRHKMTKADFFKC